MRSHRFRDCSVSGAWQLSDFVDHDWVEISSANYPNERLIVCRNSFNAGRRAAKREELLQA